MQVVLYEHSTVEHKSYCIQRNDVQAYAPCYKKGGSAGIVQMYRCKRLLFNMQLILNDKRNVLLLGKIIRIRTVGNYYT